MSLGNTSINSIQSYFFDTNFIIPSYQRPYSWKTKQLEDLWEDLIRLYESDHLIEHFFGQVVIHNDNGTKYIIDGQQRSITSILLVQAFHIILNELSISESKLNESIQQIITNEIYDIKFKSIICNTPKITLNNNCNNEFIKIVYDTYESIEEFNKIDQLKISEPSKLMIKAIRYYYKQLKYRVKKIEEPEQINELLNLLKTFKKNFKIIYLEANSLDESIIIFETLNSRGKNLETLDLLKNYIYSYEREDNDIPKKWEELLNKCNNYQVNLIKFIQDYLLLYNYETFSKTLYLQIKTYLNDIEKVNTFIEELNNLLDTYLFIKDPLNKNIKKGYQYKCYYEKYILIRKLLKCRNGDNIILQLIFSGYSDKDIYLFLEQYEIYCIRNIIIGDMALYKHKPLFREINEKIYKDKISIDKINKIINNKLISDQEFIEKFKNNHIKDKNRLFYILMKIENYYRHIEIFTDKQLINNTSYEIEHIMPKKLNKEWSQISTFEHKQYLEHIGNLTPLEEDLNKKISNKSFYQKRDSYLKSNIVITNKLANKEIWDITSIKLREREFSNIIKNIWAKK